MLYLVLLESPCGALLAEPNEMPASGAALGIGVLRRPPTDSTHAAAATEYAEAIGQYLANMGMSLNVGKCVYATTTHIPSIMVHLDPNDAVTLWVCLLAKSTVPYLNLTLDPKGVACMKQKHVLCCEALLGWCKNALGPALVPHEGMAVVVGGIVRYVPPYLSDTAEEVVRLNVAIKIAALQFENRPKNLSNVVVRCGKGLKVANIRVLRRDSVAVNVAQLTHHRSAVIKGEL